MPEEFLTLRDVSELLKLSDKTVYRLAQRGDIPAFKAGGSWRFRRLDIDQWAAAQVEDRKESGSSANRSGTTGAQEDTANGDV